MINASHADELSKKELKAIGGQYAEALSKGNFEKFKALFLNPDQLDKSRFMKIVAVIKNVEVKSVDDGNIEMSTQIENTDILCGSEILWSEEDKQERWLLLTPNGKIKYDSLLIKHPIEIAIVKAVEIKGIFSSQRGAFVNESHIKNGKVTYEELKQTGIPLFDLDIKAKPGDVSKALGDIQRWMVNDGDEWDSTAPKIFFPKHLIQQDSVLIIH